jgi:hypothetical protein
MANSIVTPQWVTRESLRILHQKTNFIGRVNRQYDDRFVVAGAKVGTTLDVRLPNKYIIRSGAPISAQNTVERFVALPVATQKGVDTNFSSVELTMQVDDFSERILRPAVSRLAANIEADVLTMANSTYNLVGTASTTVGFNTIADMNRILDDQLAPRDGLRTLTLGTQGVRDFMKDTKGLFHAGKALDEQFLEGELDNVLGYDTYSNSLVVPHTWGTYGGSPTMLTTGSPQGNSGVGNQWIASSTISTVGWSSGASTLNAGDVITIAGVYAVHDETKANLGYLKQFVVTATTSDSSGAMATLPISPGIIAGGAYQNVSALPATSAVITVAAPSASVTATNLGFHRDAYIFASADLILPGSINKEEFAEREEFEGISLRVVRRFDINNDFMPCRIDVLYGYVPGLVETACRSISVVS